MARGYVVGNKDQIYLLPPSVDDWVEKDHIVRFVWDCLGVINLKPIYDSYSHEGKPPFEPKHILGTLIYAYIKGVRSSRKMSKACHEELPFRWISGNLQPKHTVFCRFRVRHKDNFKHIFSKVLELCEKSNALDVDTLFLDGTKIQGSAALRSNRTLEKINDEIDSILQQAEMIDKEEDKLFGDGVQGGQLPPELVDPRKRFERLREAKERLEGEARIAAETAKLSQAESTDDSTDDSDDEPPAPSPKPSGNKVKASITDPDSRIMKTRTGFVQGYNFQIVVTSDQFVVATAVTQDGNDVGQLEPMLEAAKQNLAGVGVEIAPKQLAADAGYWKEGLPVEDIEENGTELFVATKKSWKQRKLLREKGAPRGRPPKDMSRRDRMERKLLTKRGYGVYRQRGAAVEAPFGQIKEGMGVNRMLLRGLEKVNAEWNLICSAFNLAKLYRSGRPLPV